VAKNSILGYTKRLDSAIGAYSAFNLLMLTIFYRKYCHPSLDTNEHHNLLNPKGGCYYVSLRV